MGEAHGSDGTDQVDPDGVDPGAVAPDGRAHARRRWPLLLVIGGLLAALYPLADAAPSDRNVEIRIADPRVAAVELTWLRDGEAHRHTELHFFDGAPATVSDPLALHDGAYQLGLVVERAGSREHSTRRIDEIGRVSCRERV